MIVEAITLHTLAVEAKMCFVVSCVLNVEGRIQIHFACMTEYHGRFVA